MMKNGKIVPCYLEIVHIGVKNPNSKNEWPKTYENKLNIIPKHKPDKNPVSL
jgi:hypothetical protein